MAGQTAPIRTAPVRTVAAAAAAYLVLLALLATTTGLGPAGWVAGIAYGAGGVAVLAAALRRFGERTFGPADRVTLARAVLAGGVTALVANTVHEPAPVPLLVALAAVALAMDAVDGWVARRTETASALGARFDMEVDAVLILVLSAYVATVLGAWVLAIGVLRYAFVAAGRMLAWLRAPLPPSMTRKTIAAAQGVALTVAAAGVLPHLVAGLLTGLALVALGWSFGHDVRWLYRRRTTSTPDTEPSRGRRIAARVTTALACLLVLFALVAPNRLGQLVPGAFVRIPLEAIVGVALLLVLPARARRVVAALAGVCLGLLTVVKLVDMGFYEAFARPFDPVFDWSFFEPGVDFLAQTVGRAGAIAVVIGAALLALAVVVLMTLAVLRLSRVVVGHRTTAARTVAVLGVVWVVVAAFGVRLYPDEPVASRSAAVAVYEEVRQVRAGLMDPQVFAREAAEDAFAATPGDELLTALRGKDVLVTFIESYGRVAVQDSEIAPRIDAVLDAGTDRLSAAGYSARSAFLTSPTAGGASWLAHATLQSGLWITQQQRYDTLVEGDRLTLSGAFRRAGWRTVSVAPEIGEAWPESEFFGFDYVHGRKNTGYRGPNFSFASMPDQYALLNFQRAERANDDRAPVMAEIDLVSSHTPWAPLPQLIDWNDIGDGSIYHRPMAVNGTSPDEVWPDPTRVRTAFADAIEYSLNTLLSYVETYGDDELVLVFLGDHQPSPIVTGHGADRDVPITLVASDQSIMDLTAGWDWHDGLNPGPEAPVWRMDAFRNQFLTTFGPRPTNP